MIAATRNSTVMLEAVGRPWKTKMTAARLTAQMRSARRCASYQASSPEAIRDHAARADLPVDEIIAVADTVVVRPDPAPSSA